MSYKPKHNQDVQILMLYILQLDTPLSTVQTVAKWQDDIEWWLEIIRLPEQLLPKKPQIIYTTNEKQPTNKETSHAVINCRRNG